MRRAAFALVPMLAVSVLSGCGTSLGPDPGLEGLAVSKVAPGTVIPGTKLAVKGASFVDAQWGAAQLRLQGQAGGRDIDVKWPAAFVDYGTMTVAVDAQKITDLGGDVDFAGTAVIEIVATSDDNTYASEPLTLDLSFRQTLAPTPTSLDGTGVIFVNDELQIDGDGFLLGGDEGTTVAKLTGCFTPDSGGACGGLDVGKHGFRQALAARLGQHMHGFDLGRGRIG